MKSTPECVKRLEERLYRLSSSTDLHLDGCHALLTLLIHSEILSQGFICTGHSGIGESFAPSLESVPESVLVPKKWNQNGYCGSFRYSKNGRTAFVTMERDGGDLVVNGMVDNVNNVVATARLAVGNYTNPFPSAQSIEEMIHIGFAPVIHHEEKSSHLSQSISSFLGKFVAAHEQGLIPPRCSSYVSGNDSSLRGFSPVEVRPYSSGVNASPSSSSGFQNDIFPNTSHSAPGALFNQRDRNDNVVNGSSVGNPFSSNDSSMLVGPDSALFGGSGRHDNHPSSSSGFYHGDPPSIPRGARFDPIYPDVGVPDLNRSGSHDSNPFAPATDIANSRTSEMIHPRRPLGEGTPFKPNNDHLRPPHESDGFI